MLEQTIINHQDAFAKVHSIIVEAQSRTWHQINITLIELYWKIGKYVNEQVATNGWGKSIIGEMTKYIASKSPSVTGFSARNIWRIKQFYDTYQGDKKLSTVLTEIGWSNHLHILAKTKTLEEKVYYLDLTAKHIYPARELARIIE